MLPRLNDAAAGMRTAEDTRPNFTCPDPRFEVRFTTPADLPAIYDLVDDAFGTSRPRAQYRWLYERNPHGPARGSAIVERRSRSIVSCWSYFPWPVAFANDALDGVVAGDSATVRRWQRQGLKQLQYAFNASTSRDSARYVLGWPNDKSVNAANRHGRSISLGTLVRFVLPLRATAVLTGRGMRPAPARAMGSVVDAVRRGWHASLRATTRPTAIEIIRRFDERYDEVTERCMYSPLYWSPHDADFLNWRYCDHPVFDYTAIAAIGDGGEPSGYTVIRTDGPRATIMEFAAPLRPISVALALLLRASEIAEDAGCAALEFAGTPNWRHSATMTRAGFWRASSEINFGARVDLPAMSRDFRAEARPTVRDLRHWQCTAGDTDAL